MQDIIKRARVPFSEDELKVTAKHRPAPYGMLPGVPEWEYRYNRPITAEENFRLCFSGEKPCWMPHVGWCDCDIKVFRPRIHPENIWAHCLCDGEATDEVRYPWDTNVGTGWFGLKWVFVPVAGGSTVVPGNPLIEDMNDWEEILEWPNLDEMDFEDMARKNADYLNCGLCNQLGVLNGCWERLISLMDVEGAAIALIDEDQQDAVKSFFDRYADLLIDYISRVKKACPNMHNVLLHDDWGHSTGAFFSLDTCREMIVPYLRKIVDACHDMGMSFELHSCGKAQTLVPAMIEAHVDFWCPQSINDLDAIAEQYKDQPIWFGLNNLVFAPDATDDEIREQTTAWFEKHKDQKVFTFYKAIHPVMRETLYRLSRAYYLK